MKNFVLSLFILCIACPAAAQLKLKNVYSVVKSIDPDDAKKNDYVFAGPATGNCLSGNRVYVVLKQTNATFSTDYNSIDLWYRLFIGDFSGNCKYFKGKVYKYNLGALQKKRRGDFVPKIELNAEDTAKFLLLYDGEMALSEAANSAAKIYFTNGEGTDYEAAQHAGYASVKGHFYFSVPGCQYCFQQRFC